MVVVEAQSFVMLQTGQMIVVGATVDTDILCPSVVRISATGRTLS
jgi:hypothetical protein